VEKVAAKILKRKLPRSFVSGGFWENSTIRYKICPRKSASWVRKRSTVRNLSSRKGGKRKESLCGIPLGCGLDIKSSYNRAAQERGDAVSLGKVPHASKWSWRWFENERPNHQTNLGGKEKKDR